MEIVLLLDVMVAVVEAVAAVAALILVVQMRPMRPDDPSNIPALSAVESLQAPQRVCVNFDAPENIDCISVTLDTSQLEMSLLNDDAW